MGQSSGEVVALAIVFPLFAILACLLRVWARRSKGQSLAWDDYLVFVAAFLVVTGDAIPTIWLAVDDNLGNHEKTLPNGKPVPSTYTGNTLQLVLEVLSHIPIGLSKCSILLLYIRIFRGKTFMIMTWATFALVVIWIVAFMFGPLFQCTPIPLYLKFGSHDSRVHCINSLQLFYAHSGSDAAMDLIIMIIPMPQIWKLKMPTRTKLAVTAIFLLGALTMAASIVRLVEFINAGRKLEKGDTDTTYLVAPTVYWSVIEGSLAVVAATLPTLRPVFRHMSPESVIASIRSVLSLQSLRSAAGSNRGATINAHGGTPGVGKNSSDSSSAKGLRSDAAITGYGGVHETFVEGPGIHLASIVRDTSTSADGIVVQRTWERSDEAV